MTFPKFAMSAIALMSTLSIASAGTIVFDFNDGTDFDGDGAGTTMTETNGIDTISITTVDILAPEYSDDDTPILTGNLLSALGGDGVETNIQGSTNSVGVNNPSVGTSAFIAAGGPSSESRDFNLNESWIIEFDDDVYIDEFNFSSIDANSSFEVTVEGIVAPFVFATGTSGDDFADPLGGLAISAGTNITFTAVGPLNEVSLRISEITVTTVPEPSALSLFALTAGVAVIGKRRLSV